MSLKTYLTIPRLSVGSGLLLNLMSAIGIVMINKYIYIHYHFPSMTLTLVHFTITSLSLYVLAVFGFFTPKKFLYILPEHQGRYPESSGMNPGSSSRGRRSRSSSRGRRRSRSSSRGRQRSRSRSRGRESRNTSRDSGPTRGRSSSGDRSLVTQAPTNLFFSTLMRFMPLSAAFCGFVVFTNLSLQYNTIGTYQLSKAMTTPMILMIQSLFFGKSSSWRIRLTVIPVLAGVLLNSYYDVRFNLYGSIFAGLGVVVTSLYQIWVGTKQMEYRMSSIQLLYYQAPISSLMLACVVPFFEPVTETIANVSLRALLVVFVSGIMALLVNLSIFWVIGKTSPLTYNMAGHFKFCVTLMIGVFLFKDPVSKLQLLGMLSTISGILLYSIFKLTEQRMRRNKKTIQYA